MGYVGVVRPVSGRAAAAVELMIRDWEELHSGCFCSFLSSCSMWRPWSQPGVFHPDTPRRSISPEPTKVDDADAAGAAPLVRHCASARRAAADAM